MPTFAAVDLGASSGRVMVGNVVDSLVELTEVLRFPTGPRPRPGGGLRWAVDEIRSSVVTGLRAAGTPASIGVDSWAVDYGLIGPDGQLHGDVRCYRDPRTTGMDAKLRALIPDDELYAINGLQHLPFNTVYQLLTEPHLADHTMLLLPDLITYWLTGTMGAEVTNASTTGLLSATTRSWSWDVVDRAGIPRSLLPPLRNPGDHSGHFESTPVVTVASHDTASAVFAVDGGAYISCGTWSLVGLQLDAPVLTSAAREANFTNEAGVDATTRFLRNTMGLWLLNESLRKWNVPVAPLLRAAANQPAFGAVVNPDDPTFLAPDDMPAAINAFCLSTNQTPPDSRPAVVRTIIESLALAHAAALRTAASLADVEVNEVRLVGGGAQNELLCQLTADACGLPVLAGPVEASALGNVLVQARAAGVRALPTPPFARYLPRGSRAPWVRAADRVGVVIP